MRLFLEGAPCSSKAEAPIVSRLKVQGKGALHFVRATSKAAAAGGLGLGPF